VHHFCAILSAFNGLAMCEAGLSGTATVLHSRGGEGSLIHPADKNRVHHFRVKCVHSVVWDTVHWHSEEGGQGSDFRVQLLEQVRV